MAKKKSENQLPPETPEQNENPVSEESSVPEEQPAPESFDSSEPEDDSEVAQAQKGTNSRLRAMMDTNFIEYASYVIKDRAIPDVDDGLKPVQRRILWAMHRGDDGTFRKAANIIGDTMKFHPHGDASIGDALVVLANKELFIEKQGNFGSIITGHPAAAPRYIEARLSPLGREIVFNDSITKVVDSYDGRDVEPVSFPVKIPSLLLMGADGIAVGTNTRIMPHNFNELLNAQIAILQDRDFEIYPDFLQGGIMDASKYEDGNGKITVRAKIDIDGRNLIIREIPPFTNTEKLMESIERAVSKGKIKIATIHDLTAKEVCIEIVPQRGYDPMRALQALYSYTDCSMTVTLNLMVIKENRPVRMSVHDVLKRNTEKLLEYLRTELLNEIGKLLEKLLSRTLAQIFVEERIYKRIETCKTNEAILKEVRNGLEKFRSEWSPIVELLRENMENRGYAEDDKDAIRKMDQLSKGIIPDEDIETLLAIPIRRISLFDIEKNKKEMQEIQTQLDLDNKHLKRLKNYAVKYLQALLDKYGEAFPRRTQIELEGFEKIDKEKIALNNIRVYWDRKACYVGTSVKSEDVVVCNEFDHLLCVERKGNYKIIDIPEKIFIDRLYEFRKYDKTTEFGIVYSDTKTGKVYYKRSVIGQFIKDKEYRICPEHCRLELITPRPNALYECRIDTPIRARQLQTINLMNAPQRSPKAGGALLFPRKLLKITFIKYLDGTEQPEEPPLIELPPGGEAPASAAPAAPEASEASAPTAEKKKKAAEPEKKVTEEKSSAPKTEKKEPIRPKPSEEDENWGISQMDLF